MSVLIADTAKINSPRKPVRLFLGVERKDETVETGFCRRDGFLRACEHAGIDSIEQILKFPPCLGQRDAQLLKELIVDLVMALGSRPAACGQEVLGILGVQEGKQKSEDRYDLHLTAKEFA